MSPYNRSRTHVLYTLSKVYNRQLNKLADKYNKPLVVATEHIWATNIEEARIPYMLGQQNAVCYHMPHEAADVLRALVGYSEYLKRVRS